MRAGSASSHANGEQTLIQAQNDLTSANTVMIRGQHEGGGRSVRADVYAAVLPLRTW